MIDEADIRHKAPEHDMENRLCSCTTPPSSVPHKKSADGSTLICTRCGRIKHRIRTRPAMAKLAEELDRILFEDEPRKIKPEGTQHTSAEGAHRPDKGTKFVQLKIDAEFSHKPNQDEIHF